MASPTLPKFALPKASTWLPAVVAVICLSLVGSAAAVLFSVGADPESGPSPVVTSVAGQGFQGLRRLLAAEGHVTATNRFEDSDGKTGNGRRGGGDQVTRGDIEVITFDAADPNTAASSMSSSSVASGEGASSSADDDNGETAAPEVTDTGPIPEKRRSDHVLLRPLGRAVIIILPKWQAFQAPTNPRWGAEPRLVAVRGIGQSLAFLSPLRETTKPADYKADGTTGLPVAPPGQVVFDGGDKLVTGDSVDYDIRRAHSVGVQTLTPAASQTLFTGPLNVGRVSDLQSIRAPNLVPVLLGPNGESVISRLIVTGGRPQPREPVYIVADPDLLDNQILADPQKVASALAIVDRLSPPGKQKPSIVFNLTFNDMAFDRDLLHALSRPPFIAVPLSLLVFGIGLMWAAFARFGPPRPAGETVALGRGVRILADNAARLMAVTLKEARLGPAYAQLIRDEVLRGRGHMRTGLARPAPNEDADDLADRIGRLSGTPDSYIELKRRSATILTVHQLIDLTRRLHAWKTHIEKTEIDRASI